MFAYVDETIREHLMRKGQSVALDVYGRPVTTSGNEAYLEMLGPVPLPIEVRGIKRVFDWYAFVRRVEVSRVLDAAARVRTGETQALRELLQNSMAINSLLAYGPWTRQLSPLVRVHSCCMTGDVFGSMRCDCGPQLARAMEWIVEEGAGAVIYMSSHEGRGIGLWAKAVTYLLQDEGQDTYQANVSLGLPEDSRDFSDAALLLRHFLQGRPVRLLSNNPLKKLQIEEAGQAVSELVSLIAGVGKHNRRYLAAKRSKGHLLPDL